MYEQAQEDMILETFRPLEHNTLHHLLLLLYFLEFSVSLQPVEHERPTESRCGRVRESNPLKGRGPCLL
jgi:hypothetical protein